jgi:hypothetical protein
MRHALGLLVLVACCKSEQPPAKDKAIELTAPPLPPQQEGDTVREGDVEVVRSDRICDRIDRIAIAKALEVREVKNSQSNGLIKGGVGPNLLSCGWYEPTGATAIEDRGINIGVSLENTTELEVRDDMDRFVWEPYDGLGQTAKIAMAYEGVHLQTIVKNVRLHSEIDSAKVKPDGLEKRLVAATKIVMAQLPGDVAAALK